MPCALVLVGLGYEAHRGEWIPLGVRQGIVALARPDEAPSGWGLAAPSGLDGVASLGYLGGYNPVTGLQGVTRFERATVDSGLNLFTSGHAPEATLMDMEGRVLHTWHHDFHHQWPDAEPRELFGVVGQDYWRRVRLLEDGDLLAIYDGFGLVKLDRDSNVLWALDGGYHHDLDVMEDGTIYVLDREVHLLPRWNERFPIVEDFLAVLSPDGEVLHRISILECFENSPYATILAGMTRRADVFHTNTLQVLDGSLVHLAPVFAKSNVLVSILEMNMVAILDPAAGKVVWALGGLWVRQHQPVLLDDGHLLVFDNQGDGGSSRVVEMDPFTQEILWSYSGTEASPLFSRNLGSCQRLENGNTLITESTAGRAIEVTRGGRIVWEFFNPHRSGQDGELVANLFEVIRLGPERPTWLDDAVALRNSPGAAPLLARHVPGASRM